MNIIKRHLFSILLILTLTSFGQSGKERAGFDPPLRIEIPVKSDNETYRLIPAGKNGLMVYYRSIEMAGDQQVNWYFSLYDTNLIQAWVVPVAIPAEHVVIDSKTVGDTLCLFMAAGGKSRESDGRIEMVRILAASGKATLTRNEIPAGARSYQFDVAGNVAWMGVNYPSGGSRIFKMDLSTDKIQGFPATEVENQTIAAIKKLKPINGTIAVIAKQITKKSWDYTLVRFDSLGRKIMEIPFSFPENKPASNIYILSVGQTDILLSGFYGPALSSSNHPTGVHSPETTGIFTIRFQENGTPILKMFNYLDFKSSTEFIGQEEIMNLKKKALKKNRSGSEYSVDFMVVPGDPILQEDHFIMTFDVFEPEYHTETYTDFDFYGRPYTNSYAVFDGYRFKTGMITAINFQGDLLWDNTLPFRNTLTMDLQPKMVAYPAGSNEYALCYLTDGIIASRIVSGGSIREATTFLPLDLSESGDKLVRESRSGLNHWYNNYFIASGFQEIKNIGGEIGNRKIVYYFTKVRFSD